MSWSIVTALLAIFAVAVIVLLARRAELAAYARGLAEREDARSRGSHEARLQHPSIDLDQCIGCGACVTACPEQGVLELIHGQALVAHGARCVGHGLCAQACPVGAIAITLGDVSQRDDLPALSEEFEAVGVPGLFIAGELSGFALVRTAIAHGTAVADAVARRPAPVTIRSVSHGSGGGTATLVAEEVLDLLIVGAGPGGLACALRARELGVDALTIDQAETIGGTVAAYPRRKLVMTQPVELPLHGKLPRLSYQKEELVELWESVAKRNELPIQLGTRLTTVERRDDQFVVQTTGGEIVARNVCLALGRRGTPRKLRAVGQDLPKVQYALLDANSYHDSQVLVVGGGDSAIEAAIGLAEQPGNDVTIAYRKAAFFRLKARNDAAIEQAIAEGRVRVMFETQPTEIRDGEVVLEQRATGGVAAQTLPNDHVFVFAGGEPPFKLLSESGVSFDPADRPTTPVAAKGNVGLLSAAVFALVVGLAVTSWLWAHRDYYDLPVVVRPGSELHRLLEPKGPIGLTCGVFAVVLFLCNLTYLVRRARRFGHLLPGSLRAWMTAHVFTGSTAFVCLLIHAAMAPARTVGGHAFWVCAAVIVTGSIGRYLYAFVPRATNGKVLGLEELCTRLSAISGEWDRDGRGFGADIRARIESLVTDDRAAWGRGFARRVFGIFRSQLDLRRCLGSLRTAGRREGIPDREVAHMLSLARRAHRLAWQAAHYEEIRAVLGSWRFFHRWLALLLVLLAVVHIAAAVRFAEIDWSVLPFWGGGSP